MNRTAPGCRRRRRRCRKPADKGGYGLRVPSTPNTPIAAAPRYSPRIITANKGKKWNVLDSGNVTSASSLPKYRGEFSLPAIPYLSWCLPKLFAFPLYRVPR